MMCSLPPPSPLAAAPVLARRFADILAGLAAVVARRFLRDPKFFRLILPLWGWLGRSARRFERAVARPRVVRAARAGRSGGVRLAAARLPSRHGWLVQALGWEAAGYGSQLEALMAEPEMVAVIAAVPAVGRILRPLCRMLAVGPRVARVRAPVVAARVPRVMRAKVARPEVVVERRHSPVSNWMHRPAKKLR